MTKADQKLGRTALHCAVIDMDISTVETLLSAKADSSAKDNEGWTPLHFAAQRYFIDAARALLKSGADANAQDAYGNSPLWRAVFASEGRGEMIGLLRGAGADADLKNMHGISPLELSRMIGNYNVRQYFSDLPEL